MKKWALYLCLIFLSACAKDEPLEQTTPDTQTEQSTSLVVNVNYLDCSTGTCIGVPIESASVSLFNDGSDINDDSAISSLETSDNGSVVFNDLDLANYVVVVDCQYGNTNEKVNTPDGQRTSILVEFE